MANIIHQHYLLPSGQLTLVVVVVVVKVMVMVMALKLVLLLLLLVPTKDHLPFMVLPFMVLPFRNQNVCVPIYMYACVCMCVCGIRALINAPKRQAQLGSRHVSTLHFYNFA